MSPTHPGRPDLSTYADVAATIRDLPVILRGHRRSRRLSLREVARQSGLSAGTVARAEYGEDLSQDVILKLLAWLDTAPIVHEETR